jgi:hypothetical protein
MLCTESVNTDEEEGGSGKWRGNEGILAETQHNGFALKRNSQQL